MTTSKQGARSSGNQQRNQQVRTSQWKVRSRRKAGSHGRQCSRTRHATLPPRVLSSPPTPHPPPSYCAVPAPHLPPSYCACCGCVGFPHTVTSNCLATKSSVRLAPPPPRRHSKFQAQQSTGAAKHRRNERLLPH
eukprot:359514-Chlamydomonas_euryale.AAC.1